MNHHDLPTDEIRRELRAIDRANRRAMPGWRRVLERVVGSEDLTTDQKAVVLGVPTSDRRSFLKLGGATILGATLFAACGSDSDGASSPTDAPGTTAAGTSVPGSTMAPATTVAMQPNQDLVLARTAASLEKLAVDAYGQAGALLTTPAVIDAATMFADHHQQHLDALNAVVTGAGGAAVTEMNQAVFDALVKPALDQASTEADALRLAVALEEAAAQTYAFAGGALSTPELRSTIMTIGGVEARHAAALRMAALGQGPAEVFPGGRAFFPGDNPLAGIDGAVLAA